MAEREDVVIRIDAKDAYRAAQALEFFRIAAKKVETDVNTAAVGTNKLGKRVDEVGKSMRATGHHGFWFNQAMFTVRRTIYGVTLGMAGLIAAGTGMGLMFNSTMEQSRIALTHLLGSASAANAELNSLFELAAKTPFEFPQLVDATRKFLAWGFSLNQANSILKDLSDAVSGLALAPDAIDRALLALGQMRSSGRVLGQEMRQLAQLGLIDPADFMRRLHISPKQFNKIGAVNIPSQRAIDAITAYWRTKFGGMAAEQQRSMFGQLSTLKDYAGRLFGVMTLPLYDALRTKIVPAVSSLVAEMQKGFEARGMVGAFAAIDKVTGSSLKLERVWQNLSMVGRAFFNLFKEVLIVLGGSLGILMSATPLWWSLAHAINFLAKIIDFFKYPLMVLINLFILDRIVILALFVATKRAVVMEAIHTMWIRRKTWALAILWVWQNRVLLSQYAYITSMWNLRIAFTYGVAILWRMIFAARALSLALLTTPIGWVILGITALATAFYLLWTRSETFRLNVKRVFGPMIADSMTLLGYLMRIADFLNKFHPPSGKDVAKSAMKAEWRPWKSGFWDVNPFAGGGTALSGGLIKVGELGPEILRVPAGTGVIPAARAGSMAVSGVGQGSLEVVIHNHIHMDAREVAYSVSRVRVDDLARR